MRVAVFCASANEVEPCYFREAGRLGKRIGELGWQLIYGGTNIGLMREVADATIRQGGEVTGIIPWCRCRRIETIDRRSRYEGT